MEGVGEVTDTKRKLSTTDRFIAEYGKDTLERIFEVIYGDATYDDITLAAKYMRDATNYYGYVYFRTPANDEIICNFEDGNWYGSEITGYGPDTEPVAETVVVRRFVLDEVRLALEGKVNEIPFRRMNLLREKDVIAEKERAYNYDITFSPTTTIRQHYQDWARERYLTLTSTVEEVPQ